MYLIALLIFIIGIVYAICVGQDSFSALLAFYDLPSLFIILLITLPMLMLSGLLRDLQRAFKVIRLKKVSYTKLELQKSLEAVRLTVRLLVLSGGFSALIGLITILKNLEDINALGPNIAVALISVFYSLFGCLIFLPIQSKLKVLILSVSEEK